ncbi:hypothetical protein GCM10022393_31510 [Aquimarina addita]|uniref:Transposase n=1 Tax=Aquimarina addita TaxID=870485 RepID=A0ABP6URI5_9FLAO
MLYLHLNFGYLLYISLVIVHQNTQEIGVEAARFILKRIKKTMVKKCQTETIAVNLNQLYFIFASKA